MTDVPTTQARPIDELNASIAWQLARWGKSSEKSEAFRKLKEFMAECRHEARAETLEEGKANWDGLARQIMMAFDANAKTPRAIFQHLRRCGEVVPKWMRDEAEMQNLDHVVSKGTRCVLIYRAMTEALRATEVSDGV